MKSPPPNPSYSEVGQPQSPGDDVRQSHRSMVNVVVVP